MKLVMFDIDGTLIETSEVDEACFVQALRETFHFDAVNTDWGAYPWRTDSGILDTLFQQRLRRSPSRSEVLRFQDRFLMMATWHGRAFFNGRPTFLIEISLLRSYIHFLCAAGYKDLAPTERFSTTVSLTGLPYIASRVPDERATSGVSDDGAKSGAGRLRSLKSGNGLPSTRFQAR